MASNGGAGIELLTRPVMARMGRALALRGEPVFIVCDDRLVPVSY